MAQQLVTRVSDAVAASVDKLVSDGVYGSRSDAVRAGLAVVIDEERRAAVGRAIADGYERLPQDDDDGLWSDAATAAMVAEEPW